MAFRALFRAEKLANLRTFLLTPSYMAFAPTFAKRFISTAVSSRVVAGADCGLAFVSDIFFAYL